MWTWCCGPVWSENQPVKIAFFGYIITFEAYFEENIFLQTEAKKRLPLLRSVELPG
jgi:hypothetical protein